jgi:sugar phosphate isomerase/epimerase
MEIKFYCPRWGSESLSWPAFIQKVKAHGYDGVEVYPLLTPAEKPAMLQHIAEAGLEFGLLHAEQTDGSNFKEYTRALTRNLYELAGYQTATLKPRFINSHTGREYYTRDQMAECLAICEQFSRETGIPVYHETHRNKFAYAAHVVKEYLEVFPDLQLVLDFSHWVCVSESYLEDQSAAIDLAVQRSAHLHARVGHLEGPQVTDPRAPENALALQHHLQWWDKWIAHLRAKDTPSCTITPEFGPYPYMAFKPGTTEPLADQWAINVWMRDLLQHRYKFPQ